MFETREFQNKNMVCLVALLSKQSVFAIEERHPSLGSDEESPTVDWGTTMGWPNKWVNRGWVGLLPYTRNKKSARSRGQVCFACLAGFYNRPLHIWKGTRLLTLGFLVNQCRCQEHRTINKALLRGLCHPEKDSYIFIWLVVWNMAFIFPIILGMSSSQLTNSIIFQRGWKHQPDKSSINHP